MCVCVCVFVVFPMNAMLERHYLFKLFLIFHFQTQKKKHKKITKDGLRIRQKLPKAFSCGI